MKILVLDPGESTGWVCCEPWTDEDVVRNADPYKFLMGGTLDMNHPQVGDLIDTSKPDVVVFERFNLYPGKAKSLSWNSFYPCEVIGVIKFKCMVAGIPFHAIAPSSKNYSGVTSKKHPHFQWMKERFQCTEHTYDALQLLEYFLRNQYRKLL